MRLVFAGTPGFAKAALAAVLSRHDVKLVLTQPDKPAGRGLRPQLSEVKQLAHERGLELYQPLTLKSEEALARLRAADAAAMVVAAYGLLLPQAVLDLFPLGCINIHASLLPRWRGAAPIQRALLAGDRETGVCIMKMDAGLDTGPVYRSERTSIEDGETAGSLHDRLAALGARLLVETLDTIETRGLEPQPQAAEGVRYAHKISKDEATIDWNSSAAQVARQVRAFDPVPGAQTRLRGELIKIWSASATRGAGATPGQVISAGNGEIVVACREDALAVRELQRAGGRRLGSAEFLRGSPISVGSRFGN
jgi:methionyl-tRNA formyltransferase